MARAYLVGAGPGDPRLLTLAALEALQVADVVLSDRLVTEEVLSLVNPRAEKIYVGKQEGEQEQTQSTIFELFEKFAGGDLIVVRLKGGDPYVFGRGAEEYLFLKKLGYEVIVIPGVSSAVGMPTLAGVPLTARGVSSGFAVVTGHGRAEAELNWADYVAVDTLVILMAVKECVHIADALIRAGRSAQECVAFIENGGRENQRVIRASLDDVKAGSVAVESPAVFVVGAACALYDGLYAGDKSRREPPKYSFFPPKPNVEIEYCPKCRWLLRAAWMAQELLITFESDVGGVSLRPSEISGAFEVRVSGINVWSRKEKGRFPEIKELKQLVRDKVAPEKNLGHSDRQN